MVEIDINVLLASVLETYEESNRMLERGVEEEEEEEDDTVIDVRYVGSGGNRMVLDPGAPVSIVSRDWLRRYLEKVRAGEEDLEKSSDAKRFRLGETVYVSEERMTMPFWMRTETGELMREEVKANIIDSEEVGFLCGEETLRDWKAILHFKRKRRELKGRQILLIQVSHLMVELAVGDTTLKTGVVPVSEGLADHNIPPP